MIASVFTAIGDVAVVRDRVHQRGDASPSSSRSRASGEWVAERSGTLNISLEGMMLAGAFGATMGYDRFGNAPAAVRVRDRRQPARRIRAGTHEPPPGREPVRRRLDAQHPRARARAASSTPSSSRSIERGRARIPSRCCPTSRTSGPSLFDRSWIFYLIFPVIAICWWLVYRTRWGLELRSAGENPQSADVSGIDVNKRRRQGIYVAGRHGRPGRRVPRARGRRSASRTRSSADAVSSR